MSGPAPELGPRAFLRWAWRQLTSMRTALLLLLLLAVAAVPGSLVPQEGVDARAVETYRRNNPELAEWLDRLGVFSTYTSVWFSAVYLLLMVSLIGCIVPRTAVYARALRARPPKAPRHLGRLPASASFTTEHDPADVVTAARRAVGRARVDTVVEDGAAELRAESGQLRELGNLVFHISVVAVLVGVATGQLFGYRGAATVVEGEGFANVLTQYDDFASGALFDADDLPPFSLTLDDLEARFQTEGPQRGAPRLFRATGDYRSTGGTTGEETANPYRIEVNHPLEIDGTSVFLVGQGYAPELRITDADGQVVFADAVPFLPSDGTYTSTGVVKVPDARPEQLGFEGFFLPTAVSLGEEEAPVSAFPGAANPLVGLFVFTGDLGIDDGDPQSVYTLDKRGLTQVTDADDEPLRITLSPGQAADLPGGGSVEFVDLRQFARLQISSVPLVRVPLVAVSIGVLGLLASLYVRPRRTWVRARSDGARTVVEVAVLDRVARDDVPVGVDDLVGRIADGLASPKERT